MQPQQVDTVSNAALVLSTLLSGVFGALIAVIGQAIYSHFKQKRDTRQEIFRTLMTTRGGAFAHPKQVEALNSIDIAFYDKNNRNRKVIEAWRTYSQHLWEYPNEGTQDDQNRWGERRIDLLVKLLQEMANKLGYPFDEVMLRRQGYYPKGWDDEYVEGIQLRRAAIAVFSGQQHLRVESKMDPEDMKAFKPRP